MAGFEPDWSVEDIDFTIALSISSEDAIVSAQEYFAERTESKVEVDRETLNESAAEDTRFSKRDAERLFTGLVLNGVAKQSGGGKSFSEYTFSVVPEDAVGVLEIQRISRAALEEADALSTGPAEPQIELTGTFPPGLGTEGITGVRPLSDDLRRIFFDADSVVRIANPYFDPSQSVVGDIASLANRGITTKILTRETESASKGLREALNDVYETVDAESRFRLEVRDLYKEHEDTGRQAHATHAKIAIADRDICYLGSANLTDKSLSSNFELGVLIRDEETVSTAIKVFDAVFEFSRGVELPL